MPKRSGLFFQKWMNDMFFFVLAVNRFILNYFSIIMTFRFLHGQYLSRWKFCAFCNWGTYEVTSSVPFKQYCLGWSSSVQHVSRGSRRYLIFRDWRTRRADQRTQVCCPLPLFFLNINFFRQFGMFIWFYWIWNKKLNL